MLIEELVSNLILGCVYGIIALGFVAPYRATGIVSFALGETVMLGAYLHYQIRLAGVSAAPALVISLAAGAGIGLIIHSLLLKKSFRHDHMGAIVLTFSAGLIIRGLAGLVWGHDVHMAAPGLAGERWQLAGFSLRSNEIAVMLATVLVSAGGFLFLRSTRPGLGFRAVCDNPELARLRGFNPARVGAASWALSGAVGALAGILIAPLTFVYPGLASLSLKGFPAAVIGGFGSFPGALAGGVALGGIEGISISAAAPYLRELAIWGSMLVVLTLFPHGLFGRPAQARV